MHCFLFKTKLLNSPSRTALNCLAQSVLFLAHRPQSSSPANDLIQFVTARKRSCEKVMFSQMSVNLLGRGGPHATSTHDALKPTPPPFPPIPDMPPPPDTDILWSSQERTYQPPPVLTSSGGQWKWLVHILLECYLVLF